MKFDKQSNEKEKLIDLIRHSLTDPILELEALINIDDKNKLVFNDFINILKRLKGQSIFRKEITKEVLNIYFASDTKFSSIRATIDSNHAIKVYCSKDNPKSSSKSSFPSKNISFINKKIYKINNKNARLDMRDYSIRFNLKRESPLEKDSTLIQEILTKWETLPKKFRYKKIYSFITKDNQFQIDLSIVRSSNNTKFFKNVETSKVFINKQEYEVEVEYIGNKLPRDKSSKQDDNQYKSILNEMYKYIGIIMQVLQRSFYIIGKRETNKVVNNYKRLIHLKTLSRNIFKGPMAVTLEKKNILRLTNKEYTLPFTGNIRKDYLVTVKADGERVLMFINNDGKVYFINRSGLVRYMGCKIPNYKLSLFDGEFIDKDKNGGFLRNYYIFDAYYIKNEDIRAKKLGMEKESNSRNKIMKVFVDSLQHNGGIFYEHPNFKLYIDKKKYVSGNIRQPKKDSNYDPDASNEDTEIFKACQQILKKVHVDYGGLSNIHQFTYAVDGLIFIPRNLGVGQEYPDEKMKEFSKSRPWVANMKWKPHFLNSYDFSVKFNIDIVTKHQMEVYRNEKLYKQVMLRVSYSPNFHGLYHNALRVLNEGLITYGKEFYENFKPTTPFSGSVDKNGTLIEDLHITNIMTDIRGNMIAHDGSIIQNGDIVEFVYDKNEEPNFRWKPKLIRSGKNKANGFHTCNQIWKQTHNPITLDMITTGENIETNEMTGTTFYKLTLDAKQYFSEPMKHYHNFVKGQLLEMAVYDRSNISLLDLGCGKMGDIHKYVKNKIKFLVGIDYSHDNIYNDKDSAPIRVINNKYKSNKIKKLSNNTMVIWGDVSKNISSGEAAMDVLNKYYLDILYGRVTVNDVSKLGKMRNKGKQHFDIVSCQFAMHYFFENIEKLEGFITNIYENLKEGGMFIGTCLDGEHVFSALKLGKTKKRKLTKKKGTSKSKSKSQFRNVNEYNMEVKVNSKGHNYIESLSKTGEVIWSITQNYPSNATKLEEDESSLGTEINFQYETFSKPTPEYLVNFNYFVNVMKNYDMELVDSKMFTEEPGSFLESFKHHCISKKISDYQKLTTDLELLNCSSLHRWFIFVKKSNLQSNSNKLMKGGFEADADAEANTSDPEMDVDNTADDNVNNRENNGGNE